MLAAYFLSNRQASDFPGKNRADRKFPKWHVSCVLRCKRGQQVGPMNFRDFRKAGHWPTLLAAFLYFDFSFMVWVTLGPLIIYISRDLNIAVEEKFTLVAIPILAGALLRLPVGMLADHFGGKRTATVAQLLVIAAMAYAWVFGLSGILDVQVL